MLRGINVGGRNSVKMDQLRTLFETQGLKQVRTYIQSGNVIFTAAQGASVTLSKKLQNKISQEFGLSIAVIVKTSEEVRNAIKNNPFLKEKPTIVSSKLYITFLSGIPEKDALKKLTEVSSNTDQLRYFDKAVYLYCPQGYGKTKLSNNILERILSVRATTRNWKTTTTLYEMSITD